VLEAVQVKAAKQLEGEAVGDPLAAAGLQNSLGESLLSLGHPQDAISLFVKSRATRTAQQEADIHRLLDQDKLEEIERFCSASPTATLSEAKTHFGSKFDYGDLRFGMSYLRSRKK